MTKKLTYTLSLLLLLLISITIAKILEIRTVKKVESTFKAIALFEKPKYVARIPITDTIQIAGYFNFMDSLVTAYDSLTDYPLSEHLLVKANPWIIDTLSHTDYYYMKKKDSFVYDQQKMVVLRPYDTIIVPDAHKAELILSSFARTSIDINLPEFKLRIYQDSVLLHSLPVRIGQNRSRYLKMGDRVTDLRTKTGYGHIVGFRRNPDFYNPVDGKKFEYTRRDDGKTTLMPQIPWIETEINGVRNGQLIHPTTNPKTLKKAYSNGCIGVKEGDAWIIYYHCPIGTPLHIRYDLKSKDSKDSNLLLIKDIYHLDS